MTGAGETNENVPEDREGRLTGWISVALEAYELEWEDPTAADRVYQEGLQQYPESASLLGYYAAFLRDIRRDYDRAEEYYERALRIDPRHADNLGSYALYMQHARKHLDRAEELYQRAVQAPPNGADYLGAYALFLEDVRHDYDRAEDIYRRAVQADPNDANTAGNFALFLELIRHDYDQAERHYRQALQADPYHANNLANYAVFLHQSRRDYGQARQHYEQASRLSPKNANLLGNYAGLLLSQGETHKGGELLERVFSMLPDPAYETAEVEARFYAYAHWSEEERAVALKELKRLLVAGVRSPGWDFSANIERAAQDGHPAAQWLRVLADVIAQSEDMSKLDEWEEWREC